MEKLKAIKNLCIKNNYFTWGSMAEWDEMFEQLIMGNIKKVIRLIYVNSDNKADRDVIEQQVMEVLSKFKVKDSILNLTLCYGLNQNGSFPRNSTVSDFSLIFETQEEAYNHFYEYGGSNSFYYPHRISILDEIEGSIEEYGRNGEGCQCEEDYMDAILMAHYTIKKYIPDIKYNDLVKAYFD